MGWEGADYNSATERFTRDLAIGEGGFLILCVSGYCAQGDIHVIFKVSMFQNLCTVFYVVLPLPLKTLITKVIGNGWSKMGYKII